MNSYFQIIVNEEGVLLKAFPATDGGDILMLNEVTNYLEREKIPYELVVINQFLKNVTSIKQMILTTQRIHPISESCSIRVTDDKMMAIARFYPPSNQGKLYRKEDIYAELKLAKIVFGADETMINDFMEHRQYCTDYPIARGIPAAEGKDAVIKYYFNVDNKIRPTLREDGTVDFFHLNLVNHCKVGDVLAVLTPEDKGKNGNDVVGNIIKPHDVRRLTLSYGLNTELSEDRTVIRSKVNGHVSLVDGKVFVSDVLEVENVDNSTGNISYEGSVLVNGNVCSNFAIKALGNIEVKGVVEGAYIEAGGNIILNRGINGMGRGKLIAKGNVVAKYMENCYVLAEGSVETDAILHSNVQAGTEIKVMSRKGFITGGAVCATNQIKVKNLGSPMGADTSATVGIDPTVTNRFSQLQKEVADAQKNLKVMMPVLDATKKKLSAGVKMLPEQIKNLQQLAISSKQLQEVVINNTKEIEELKVILESSSGAKIEVSGEVYTGTRVTISDVSMIVKDTVKYCRFTKEDGMVKMGPL